jgi:hypothetical protein
MIFLCGSRTESPRAFDGAPATTKVDCWPIFLAAYRDTRPVKWVWVLHRPLSLWRKFHTETIRLGRCSLHTFDWRALVLSLYRGLADGRSFCSQSYLVPGWSWSWDWLLHTPVLLARKGGPEMDLLCPLTGEREERRAPREGTIRLSSS